MASKVKITDLYVLFHCPGCNKVHAITSNRWQFNRNNEAPTITPSILVQGRDFTEKGQADFDAWHAAGCPPRGDGYKFESAEILCHSFVTDGRIQFLTDSKHHLAGQTVELPDWVD